MKRTALTLAFLMTIGGAALAIAPTTTAQSGSCYDGITIFGNRVACEGDPCFAQDNGGTGYICGGEFWCSGGMCASPICVTSTFGPCFFEAPPAGEDCLIYTGTGVNLICNDPARPGRICITSTYIVCPPRDK